MRLPLEWQPVTGCSAASAGCANCKSPMLAPVDIRAEFARDGLVVEGKTGPVWTGTVRLSEARLKLPAETSSPTEFIVCPHSDLFHENVPDQWLDRVFDEIEKCPQHAFHILTKRTKRMQAYVSHRYVDGSAVLPRVVFGVSCERQAEADERIPMLQATPAALRTMTLFPLLGPVDLSAHLAAGGICAVMVGTEKERPADPAWVEAIARQCAAARVAFHFTNYLIGQSRSAAA